MALEEVCLELSRCVPSLDDKDIGHGISAIVNLRKQRTPYMFLQQIGTMNPCRQAIGFS